MRIRTQSKRRCLRDADDGDSLALQLGEVGGFFRLDRTSTASGPAIRHSRTPEGSGRPRQRPSRAALERQTVRPCYLPNENTTRLAQSISVTSQIVTLIKTTTRSFGRTPSHGPHSPDTNDQGAARIAIKARHRASDIRLNRLWNRPSTDIGPRGRHTAGGQRLRQESATCTAAAPIAHAYRHR